jgi:protein-disulfide isomerase
MSSGVLSPAVGPDDHAHGAADAPITLVEYGDYECPHCGRAHAVIKALQRSLGASLRFVFRNFPLREAHPHAMHAAEAAESVAARSGETAFWAMHDLIYENQDALEDSDLLEYAVSVGVDPAGVAQDLADGVYAARVRADFRGGVRSGVNGTPTFFVNGRRYDSDWSSATAFAADLRSLVRTGAHR